jgi:hypothetical protein
MAYVCLLSSPPVAQWSERGPYKPVVAGSIPARRTGSLVCVRGAAAGPAAKASRGRHFDFAGVKVFPGGPGRLAFSFGRGVSSKDEFIQPHPKNVPGPFYVVDGCCTACDVPVSEAPDLFTYDTANHCFVKCQPRTEEEFDRVFRAAWAAELECIRYRGDNPVVLRRFAELGSPHLCDVAPPPEIRPVMRDHVTFDADSPEQQYLSAVGLADRFRAYLLSLNKDRGALDTRFHYRFRSTVGDSISAGFAYSWYEDNYHAVQFCVIGEAGRRWLAWHSSAAKPGGRGVSNPLDKWLKIAGGFRAIRWYVGEEWKSSGKWRTSPQ